MLPRTSALMGHGYPADTARDYVDPLPHDLEMTYLRDVLTKSTEEVCEIWFGGLDEAAAVVPEVIERTAGLAP
mgnify:CR=1 FL=1